MFFNFRRLMAERADDGPPEPVPFIVHVPAYVGVPVLSSVVMVKQLSEGWGWELLGRAARERTREHAFIFQINFDDIPSTYLPSRFVCPHDAASPRLETRSWRSGESRPLRSKFENTLIFEEKRRIFQTVFHFAPVL